MKKLILLTLLISFTAPTTLAYPGADYTFGGAPFAIMQQNNFQRNEVQDYNNRKRMDEEYFDEEIGEQPLPPRKQDTKLQLKNSDTKNYTPKYNDNSRPPSYDRKSRLEKGDDDKIYIKFWEHLDD